MSCGSCGKIVGGAVGLAKAALRIDPAPDPVIQARRDVCRECPEATRKSDPKFAAFKGLTSLSRCVLCDCFIAAKTKIASEKCPKGKW